MTTTTPNRPALHRRGSTRKPARATPATHCAGIVTAVEPSGFRVASGELVALARRAASCLLEPARGDSVACLLVAPDEVWILAVLQREEGVTNVLRCDGPTRVEIDAGPLSVNAERIDLASRRFSLETGRAEVSADDAHLIGRELRVIGTTMKLVGSLLSTVFDRVTHYSQHHQRTTEGLDRVQAAHIEQQAKQLLRLSGEHALIDGAKLVKTRGGQIHFG